MNCPNCGRALAEGEVCTCTQENEITTPSPAPEQEEIAEMADEVNQPYQAAPQYQPPQGAYYVPPQPDYYNNGTAQANAPYYQPVTPIAARTDYPDGYKIKRKYAAVLLAATLGVFGIHNFYLGDSNKAIIHILVATLGSIVFGLGFVASAVWAIVEAVQLLTDTIDRDTNGFKIQTFEEALVKTKMEAEEKK